MLIWSITGESLNVFEEDKSFVVWVDDFWALCSFMFRSV